MNESMLFAHRDVVEDIFSPTQLNAAVEALNKSAARGDSEALATLTRLLTFEPATAFSWLHGRGRTSPYASLEILDALPAPLAAELAWQAALSAEGLLPFDYRALAFARLAEFHLTPARARQLAELIERAPAVRWRSDEEKLRLPTDGIDHLFAMPADLESKLQLLASVTRECTAGQIALLAGRLLRAQGWPAPEEEAIAGLRNLEVESMIEGDLSCAFLKGTDYLVPWDRILSCGLTFAELSRLLLFSGELHMPSPSPRLELMAAQRACLRTSGRSIIGLKAGTFHVEHGTLAAPSYFYMGRDSALGKGCVIDNIGGAVMLSESFLGGGFMPILIHTHKHRRRAGESAIQERQFITPGVFVALTGHRLPMSCTGILEMTDYLGKNSPYPGMTCWPIQAEVSVSHRRIVP